MAKQGNLDKQVVWQDIIPAKKTLRTARQKGRLGTRIKRSLSFRDIKPMNRSLEFRKYKLFARFVIIVLAFLLIGYFVSTSQYLNGGNTDNTSASPVLERGTPSFPTVSPPEKDIDSLGGWTRVSPSASDPVYAFTDKIGNVPIIVSQQTLPSDFKADTPSKIQQLAADFSANEKIVIDENTIYIGTSSNGVQSVIFSLNNLLILIKSDDRISNDSWAQYIRTLN